MLKNNSVKHCVRTMPHFLWQTRLEQGQHPGNRPFGGLFAPLNDLMRTFSTPSDGSVDVLEHLGVGCGRVLNSLVRVTDFWDLIGQCLLQGEQGQRLVQAV